MDRLSFLRDRRDGSGRVQLVDGLGSELHAPTSRLARGRPRIRLQPRQAQPGGVPHVSSVCESALAREVSPDRMRSPRPAHSGTNRLSARVRVFLLSPADCSGERAQLLLRPQAQFELARELQSPLGARLRDVFSFMSGLYFRGKLAYVDRFGRPGAKSRGGLMSLDQRVRPDDLRRFAAVAIEPKNPSYRLPLERDAQALAKRLGPDGEAVLLGSVATGKYTEVLLTILARRLRFPAAFVGRGDMSRGSLMLRCAGAGLELEYLPVPAEPVHASTSLGHSRG